MAKSKTGPSIVADNGADDISVRFYVSDIGATPRVEVSLLRSRQSVYIADHALAEYSTMTPTQKTNLRTLLTIIRDETFALEGFT